MPARQREPRSVYGLTSRRCDNQRSDSVSVVLVCLRSITHQMYVCLGDLGPRIHSLTFKGFILITPPQQHHHSRCTRLHQYSQPRRAHVPRSSDDESPRRGRSVSVGCQAPSSCRGWPLPVGGGVPLLRGILKKIIQVGG